MAISRTDPGFRRREVFRFAAIAGITGYTQPWAFGADFWTNKKPSEWTDEQKEEIRTKSPWAKKVDAEMAGGGGRGGGGGEGGDDSGGGRGGGRGGGGGGGGGRGGGGGGQSVVPQGNFGQGVTLHIVWQSAKPIQDAHPIQFPPKLENHYVIAVTGIPQQVLNAAMRGPGGGRRGGGQPDGAAPPPDPAPATPPDPTAGLKRGSMLTVKGKTPQNADAVMSLNNNQAILFAFAKDTLALAATDKEVEFDLKLGNLSAKAKFNLKDMMYQEQLAV